jgi:ubiquinone/menaquinone biosynthesis C-methylase UbiE
VSGERPPDEVLAFYALGLEPGRLELDYFPLERARTQELIRRHIPPPPAVVLDVGGGAGAYSFWLTDLGYEVHLVDPVPLHVERARTVSARRAQGRLASVEVGDARALSFGDRRADAVLLLGPLYHLTEAADRSSALREALRVLRPGGLLVAAAISRFASLVDGLRGPLFDDAVFASIVERDLATGQHRNETNNPRYFTTAFFHDPAGLAEEIGAAGFGLVDVVAVEGLAASMPDFDRRFTDAATRERLLAFLRTVESEPALLGASPHLLAVARRPDTETRRAGA